MFGKVIENAGKVLSVTESIGKLQDFSEYVVHTIAEKYLLKK